MSQLWAAEVVLVRKVVLRGRSGRVRRASHVGHSLGTVWAQLPIQPVTTTLGAWPWR